MCPARRPWRSIGLLVMLVVLAAMLGGAASAQVATLGSPAPDASAPAASPTPEGQQALLEWAACMRDNGIGMDDPRFGLDGKLTGGLGKDGEGKTADTIGPEYQAAIDACVELLTAYKAPPDPEAQVERLESLLVWATCMREHGVDIPDPGLDGTWSDYDWKLDAKSASYTAADEACRAAAGVDIGK